MKLLKVAIIMVLIYSVSSPITRSVFAHHTDLDATLYQYERLIKEERYEQAETLLLSHKDDLTKLFTNHTATQIASGLGYLLESNLTIVNDNEVDHQTKKVEALRLVLAVDALTNPESPILATWASDMESSLKSVVEEQHVYSDSELEELLTAWSIVKPAMQIYLETDQFYQLQESYQNLEAYAVNGQQVNPITEVYRQMGQIQPSNAHDGKEEKKDLTFIWMITIVGGFIFLTLAYVATKKYKAEKHKNENQKQSI
ncbi:sporulation protein YpjB [Radiobacillus sp. PE A8.2]|uniref:sporulation protein YpjB n=1 Tax=Radiobacillus sp. PE A8.2 TaxID=3380349 RepID=UPI00388CEFB3